MNMPVSSLTIEIKTNLTVPEVVEPRVELVQRENVLDYSLRNLKQSSVERRRDTEN